MDYKLRYLIDADGRKAINELRDVDKQIEKVGAGVSTAFGGGVANALGAATVGITALGAAGIAVTRQLFDMSKAASEYGSAIFDASEKTGLHAESLSAMDFAAKQSGSSLEAITGAIAKYSKTVGAAIDGSKEAAENLTALGVDPQEALNDLDGSLAKVFDRIAKAKPGIEQITLAQKAFGKSGADLLPFIKSFDGDLAGLIRRAKELGVTINDEAARAADEFGDQLDTLNAQFEAIERTIGMAFMPVFMDMAKQTSEWAVRNKDEITDWANASADAFNATGTLLSNFATDVSNATSELLKFKAVQQLVDLRNWWVTSVDPLGAAALKAFNDAQQDRLMRPDVGVPYGPGGTRTIRSGGSVTSTGVKPPKENDAEFRRFFQERGFSVNRTFGAALNEGSLHPSGLAADISIAGKKVADIFLLTAAALEKGYRLFDERVKRPGVKSTAPHLHFERGGRLRDSSFLDPSFYGGQDQLDYLKSLDAARVGKGSGAAGFSEFQLEENKRTLAAVKEGLDQEVEQREAALGIMLGQIENEESLGVLTKREANDQRMKLDEEYLQFRLDKLHEEMVAAEGNAREEARITQEIFILNQKKETTDAANKAQRRRDELDEFKESMEIQSRLMVAANEKEKERLELLEKQNQARRDALMIGPNPDNAPAVAGGGLLGMKGSILDAIGLDQDLENNVTNRTQIITDAFTRMGGMIGNTVNQMAQGVGSLVENWVLYGTAGPDAMRKMAAAVLGSLAAQATVEAIMELARGFAALANPFTAWQAPLHFKSAALFGVVAAGAALAGRAIAGDSFTKDSRGSGGAGSGSSSGSSGDRYSHPVSRVSEDAFISGRRPSDSPLVEIGREIARLNDKITSMRPGEVVARGINQQPGLIGQTFVKDVGRDSSIGTAAKRVMGDR